MTDLVAWHLLRFGHDAHVAPVRARLLVTAVMCAGCPTAPPPTPRVKASHRADCPHAQERAAATKEATST